MKSKNYSILNSIRVLAIIIALTFSTNMNASTSLTWGSWWSWFSWGSSNDSQSCSRCGSRHSGSCGGTQGGGGTSIPLDGGLGILLVGAAALGIKKLRDNKNDKL